MFVTVETTETTVATTQATPYYGETQAYYTTQAPVYYTETQPVTYGTPQTATESYE